MSLNWENDTVLIFQLFDEALPLQIKENEASHSRYYSHIGLTLGTQILLNTFIIIIVVIIFVSTYDFHGFMGWTVSYQRIPGISVFS